MFGFHIVPRTCWKDLVDPKVTSRLQTLSKACLREFVLSWNNVPVSGSAERVLWLLEQNSWEGLTGMTSPCLRCYLETLFWDLNLLLSAIFFPPRQLWSKQLPLWMRLYSQVPSSPVYLLSRQEFVFLLSIATNKFDWTLQRIAWRQPEVPL